MILQDAYRQNLPPDIELHPGGLPGRQIPIPHHTVAWGRELPNGSWEVEARVAYTSGGWWTFRFEKIPADHVSTLSKFPGASVAKSSGSSAVLAAAPSDAAIEAANLIFQCVSETPDNQLWKIPEEVRARVPADLKFEGKEQLHKCYGVVNLLFSKNHTWDEFQEIVLPSQLADEKLRVALSKCKDDAACQQKLRAMFLDAYKDALNRAGVALNDDDGGVCTVCLGEIHTVLLQPCGHLCLCAHCFEQIREKRCPLCRMNVTTMYQYPEQDHILLHQRPVCPSGYC